ncbi:type II secretory pathway predicted ATPase ExeA [Bradyrhizobium sp. CIR48]|uniref:ATP-binding protein n=1 Tax=Bradyrhizobium sp. CIR48 TaxID=2663840 RepID=UPI00160643D1|nr:ATP-binding protein [Bradyrhizobium sp. CIR48]MBB4423903.1 type II secretory pathway predicted ATPase ExeA [Bradyrhizobium sp. CIR48]
MMLTNYWPQAAAVNACIKNEAETADISVLLAVHQPSPLVQRNAGTNLETLATEKDLLDAFLTNDVPGGALIVPITGPSGVGKSHIIRWLDAQLHRSPKSKQLHIIRIPKSASLRTVVELILAPLANDPRYAKPSADLNRAVAEVNVKDAVITFRAHLENALSARRERMIAELREHPNRTHLKALIGHAEKLPRLFSDAALDQHFITNVLTRIVARAIGGRSESDDETLSQFAAEDLMLPREIDLNQAARQVREYYQVQIAIAPAERLKPIVDP